MCLIRVSSPDAEVTVLGNCGIKLRIELLLVQLSQRGCPSCSACWLGHYIVNGDSSLKSIRGARSEPVTGISLFPATKVTVVR